MVAAIRLFAKRAGITTEVAFWLTVWVHTRYFRSVPSHIVGILLASRSELNARMAPILASKVRHSGLSPLGKQRLQSDIDELMACPF